MANHCPFPCFQSSRFTKNSRATSFLTSFSQASRQRRRRVCRHLRHPQSHYYGIVFEEVFCPGPFQPRGRNSRIPQSSAVAHSNQSKRERGSQPPGRQRRKLWRPCGPAGALEPATSHPPGPAQDEYFSIAVAPGNLGGSRYRLPRR